MLLIDAAILAIVDIKAVRKLIFGCGRRPMSISVPVSVTDTGSVVVDTLTDFAFPLDDVRSLVEGRDAASAGAGGIDVLTETLSTDDVFTPTELTALSCSTVNRERQSCGMSISSLPVKCEAL